MGSAKVSKQWRSLIKRIKPYGLCLRPLGKSGHLGVFSGEERILVMAGSPRSLGNTERYVLGRLRKRGHLPADFHIN